MGGRKGSKVEKIIGKSPELKRIKNQFLDAVRSEEPKRIISSAVSLLSNSSQAINSISQAARFLSFIKENKNKEPTGYQERKEEVAKEWAKIKKGSEFKTTSEIDKIFIESAVKVIRRGKK